MKTAPEPFQKADIIDRIHERIAVVGIVIALALGLSLSEEFLSGPMLEIYRYAAWAAKGLLLLLFAHLVFLIYSKWKARNQASDADSFSFTNHIVHKAAAVSWVVGIALISLDNRLFSAIPTDTPITFMSHFLHAAMFGTYGVAFLILNRNLDGSD